MRRIFSQIRENPRVSLVFVHFPGPFGKLRDPKFKSSSCCQDAMRLNTASFVGLSLTLQHGCCSPLGNVDNESPPSRRKLPNGNLWLVESLLRFEAQFGVQSLCTPFFKTLVPDFFANIRLSPKSKEWLWRRELLGKGSAKPKSKL